MEVPVSEMNSLFAKLAANAQKGKRLCVGLDPVLERIPNGMIVSEFLRPVIEVTAPIAAVFKPNIAFFEGRGEQGLLEYADAIAHIRLHASGVPIIGDWKRGDIGKSNAGYIRAAFDNFGVDAITVHPLLGEESIRGFLDRKDKTTIVLCRTSNLGSDEFQNLVCDQSEDPCGWADKAPLYQVFAHRVATHWDQSSNRGLVVGATYPRELAKVREIAPNMFLLIPGVGTQGGDLVASVQAAHNPKLPADFVINVSSGILYAFEKGEFDTDPANFAKAAAKAAASFDAQIREALAKAA